MYKKITFFALLFALIVGVILYYRHQSRMEHGAYAALQSGYLNLKKGKKLQAMGDFSFLTEFYGRKHNSTVQEIVAEALLKKAEILVEVNNADDAILTLEQLSNLYLDSKNQKLKDDVALALFRQGNLLLQQKEYEPAMLTLSHLVSVYGRSNQIETKRMVVQAMYLETEILNHWKKNDTALNIQSSIIEQFINEQDPAIRLVTAKSLMARTANRLNNREWGPALFNSNLFIKIFSKDASPTIKEYLAHNLLYRAEILHRVKTIPKDQKELFGNNPQEAALATYDELLTAIADHKEGEYPRYKVTALLGKAQIFQQQKKYTEALELCNQIYNSNANSAATKIKDVVAKSLLTKAQILNTLKQYKQALIAYQQIIQSYHYDDSHYTINDVLLSAYIESSAILELLDNNTEALKLLSQAVQIFQNTHNEHLYYKVSIAYMAMANLQVKMHLLDDAISSYTSLISMAHHKTLPSIRYNGALAIIKKAHILIELKKGAEIKQTYDLLTTFYQNDENMKVREIVAQGMYDRAKSLFEHNRGYTAVNIIRKIFELFDQDKSNPVIHDVLEKTKELQKQLGSTIVW
ncbi:hypothetical protein [Commensalibacter nepenthis]|uniref:Tetratricopeptide repeat protein n=1 Tax=Commensalibacter nepenthis TaxID=3043872 RepID=A0ABT6Q940_9PROT|nr:hypothetical protein [Commensalibacter sp. TBRC 10068]MDI2113426.1 hypothetical protein [Commensalibacter sp. TBRC 10068]